MLAEAIQYLATPAPLWARQHGFVSDSVALWSRARRCAGAWAEHEKRTRATFERAIDRCPRRRVAVVLGSGLLRDVPIARLRRTFREVILVDAVHLASVRLQARLGRWDNVRFVSRDLSGLDRLIEHERVRMVLGEAEIGAPVDPLAFLRRERELDLVLSANLLSQIAVGVRRRLDRRRPADRLAPDDTVPRLVAAHLDGLAAVACAAALVTDTAYERRTREGLVLESRDLLDGVMLPPADDAWDWPVAPFGEEERGIERVHRVVALDDVALDLR